MNRLHVMLGILIIMFSVPNAAAITVDGVRSAGEWSDAWAFGQEEAAGYNPMGPFGDRMVLFQEDGAGWRDTDPQDDSGPDYDQTMATEGPNPSGYDIENLYARYDPSTDTLYGMCTVYGLPGDLDGDGAIDSLIANGDTVGPTGKPGITGMGIYEQFSLSLCKNGTTCELFILVSGNDWVVLDENDNLVSGLTINAANSQDADAVYEVSVTGLATHPILENLQPGDTLEVHVVAGGNRDIPGEDQTTFNIDIPNPDIEIQKATNGFDADFPRGPTLEEGDAITWTYVVTNKGDVPLSNVVVTDDKLGTVPDANIISMSINDDDILDVGEVWTYEMTGTAECGQYANIADVIGYYGPISVTYEDPSHYYVICTDIDLEKHTNGFDADYPMGPQIEVGETITWEYFVTNDGKVPLMNIVLVDDQLGTIPDSSIVSRSINNDEILDVGEVWTYVVTDTLDQCIPLYKNIADVTGEDADGNEVFDSDPSHFHCQPVVPVLTPVGIMGLIASLGVLGIITIRRRD